MAESYHDEVRRRIGNDLASFADPGSIKLAGGQRAFVAEWSIRGEPREAKFTISPERGITVRTGTENVPYRVYLAGAEMADLRRIAQMIVQTESRDIFVPTRAQRTDRVDGNLPATELLAGFVDDGDPDVTQIIMITGEAGAGKTKVLTELVVQQAQKYLDGETDKLLLYVNAQGRALARLNEALAIELQDLRVNLTYHSVATLARIGLLVPVIDGFDELLGISGYDDAFNSLGAFLEQLEGQGQILASARSVYYEEEFLSRASRVGVGGASAWSHIPVEIVPWEYTDRSSYVDEVAKRVSLTKSERELLDKRIGGVFQGNEELAGKPLFFAKTVSLLLEDSDFLGGEDLLETLSKRYLEREQTEKLLDRDHRPLLPENQLESLMDELAEEMWNQETNELDYGSVREVAEYVLADKDVSELARQVAVERMPTLAFLASGEKHATIRFEHEIFFFHFLARALARQVADHKELRVILSRSPLPEFVAERLAIEVRKNGGLLSLDDMQDILDQLSHAGATQWRRTVQVKENAGLLVLAVLREYANMKEHDPVIVNRTLNGLIFPGGHLQGVTLDHCNVIDVEFRRTDLVNARFIQCVARDVLLVEPLLKLGATRLELLGLNVQEDVHGVRQLRDEGNKSVYAPHEIAKVLHGCGAPVDLTEGREARVVSEGFLNLLERLMRVYERSNIVCDGDQNLESLFRDSRWPVLRDLLTEYGIISRETRAASGPSKNFYRRQFVPEEIMKGLSKDLHAKTQVLRFWDALEAVET